MRRAARLWVIAYDIVEDKTRRQVERTLLGIGDRVQYSVFEATLTMAEMRKTKAAVGAMLQEGDNVLFYPLCTWCENSVGALGLGRRASDPSVIVL